MLRKAIAPVVVIICILLFIPCIVLSQTYPTKVVRMVVPYPPGGSNDVLARHLSQKLTPALGQSVIVENRAGASGAMGADYVAKSAPDGYTLLFNSGSFAASAAAEPDLSFDTEKDFVAVAGTGVGPMLLTVHPSLPVKSVNELIQLAKSRPGELNYSTSGIAGINHLATEMFLHMAKIKIVHVPYKGMSPAVTDLIGGRVQMLITTFPSIGPQVKAGRVKALAVTTPTRSPFAPELPTISEAGVPGYKVSIWWGLFAPAGTPEPIINRLNSEVRKILETADMKEKLAREGAEPLIQSPEQFRTTLRSDIAMWHQILKDANIKIK
jgi:tripartite-type tricarboxylate transporter receptor subunit TctC